MTTVLDCSTEFEPIPNPAKGSNAYDPGMTSPARLITRAVTVAVLFGVAEILRVTEYNMIEPGPLDVSELTPVGLTGKPENRERARRQHWRSGLAA